MKTTTISTELAVAWAEYCSLLPQRSILRPSVTLTVSIPFSPKRRSSPRSHCLIPCNSNLLLPWLIFLTWLAPLVIELQSLECSKLYSLAPIVLGHCINPHYSSVLRGKKSAMNTNLCCHTRSCSCVLELIFWNEIKYCTYIFFISKAVQYGMRHLCFDCIMLCASKTLNSLVSAL